MTRFYISDLHYDHENILNFLDNSGMPLRPFASLDEMQATICHNWNKTVSNSDTIYVLGDVTIGRTEKSLSFLETLRGRKILVRGNHDKAKLSHYSKYFVDIRAYDIKPGIICSHIPIHTDSIERFGINVHGHLHINEVYTKDPRFMPEGENAVKDKRYLNVCCEKVNYTPISYEEIIKKCGIELKK